MGIIKFLIEGQRNRVNTGLSPINEQEGYLGGRVTKVFSKIWGRGSMVFEKVKDVFVYFYLLLNLYLVENSANL